jgi:surfactin synthase thioesterase subunit
VRLVCFPWAGGGASVYKRFAAYLPGTIEMLAVQYPGREERFSETRLVRMEHIVRAVIEDVIAIFDRPLVFLGHSMGALVAYEVAQAIKTRLGREPRMLIASGAGSPDTQASYGRCASNASDEEFISDIRRLGGTPRAILDNPQMMRALLPLLRADYAVLDTYVSRSGSPLACEIMACCGDQDPSVSNATLTAWRNFTTGPFRKHWFRGDHFYLSSAPEQLAAGLREWIEPDASCRPVPASLAE